MWNEPRDIPLTVSDSAMPHLAEGAGFEPTVTKSKFVVLPTTLSLHMKRALVMLSVTKLRLNGVNLFFRGEWSE